MSHTFRFLGNKTNHDRLSWVIDDPFEIKHIQQVLRLSVGTVVEVTDGAGCWIEGKITKCDRKKVMVESSQFHQDPQESTKLSLAIGALRHSHIDDIISPLCELGVAEFHIFLQQNDKSRINQKALERWQRLIKSAIKQSKRSWLPNIKVYQDLESLLAEKETSSCSCYYLNSCERQSILDADLSQSEVLIVVGGEKGLSDDDVAMLQSRSFSGLTLGKGTLRAKTAAIASATIFSLKITSA